MTMTATKVRTGILEKAKDAKGRTYWRGKIYLNDNSLPRVRIDEGGMAYAGDLKSLTVGRSQTLPG